MSKRVDFYSLIQHYKQGFQGHDITGCLLERHFNVIISSNIKEQRNIQKLLKQWQYDGVDQPKVTHIYNI